MSPAEAAIREALDELDATGQPGNMMTPAQKNEWSERRYKAAMVLMTTAGSSQLRPLISELDALRTELSSSRAAEASLRARCEAAEALLRRCVPRSGKLQHDIDAHLKGAGRE